MFTHILIPTDGSRLSNEAALAGVRLAKALGARVTALFAAPPATPVIYRGVLPAGLTTGPKHQKMIEKAGAGYLAVVAEAARKAGVQCETVAETSDFPAQAILQAARKRKCDLIFMASHGHRGLRGVLLGSETQKVLAEGTIPVLVFRKGR